MKRSLAAAVMMCAVAHAQPPAPTGPSPDGAVEQALTQAEQLVSKPRLERSDLLAARAELLKAFSVAPTHPGLLYALGQIEFNLGNYGAAVDYYKRCIAAGPEGELARA